MSLRKIKNYAGVKNKERIFTSHRKAAFTLAEVLITLGIIGVVAALTLPTLIANINDKVTENQVKVFNAKFIKGLNLTKTAGDMNDTYSSTYDFLQNALSKNLKMAKICSSDNLRDCIPYDKIKYDTNSGEEKTVDVSSLKTAKNLNLKAKGFEDTAAFVLADGTPVILSYDKNCFSDPDQPDKTINSCVAGLYDLNGSRKPNKFKNKVQTDKNGEEISSEIGNLRSFNGASISGGGDGCVSTINKICFVTSPMYGDSAYDNMFAELKKKDSAYTRSGNNWQMAKDYCEIVQNGHLPTKSELEEISKLSVEEVAKTFNIPDNVPIYIYSSDKGEGGAAIIISKLNFSRIFEQPAFAAPEKGPGPYILWAKSDNTWGGLVPFGRPDSADVYVVCVKGK